MEVVLYFRPASISSAPGKLAGVLEVAEKNGWHVQAIDGIPSARRIRELTAFWNPIGAIAECGSEYGDVDTERFGDLPVVFLSHNPRTLPDESFAVFHDSAETAKLAAKELMMTGFGNFAYIPGAARRYWSEERRRAFSAALALNGKKCRTFRCGVAPSDAVGRQSALRGFLRSLPKPCAVFAANDMTAAETVTAARFEHIAIPEEMAVIGVDNYEQICEHTVPPITSIEPDFRKGGNIAATMLLSMTGGKGATVRRMTFGPLRIVRRASTRLLAVNDKLVGEALDMIRKEACIGLRAGKVAKVLACSRRMAGIRFRKATGRSILEEIHAVQLERAKQLLSDTSIPLKSLCDFCGFGDENSLRKFFRRETGFTMGEWRRSGGKPSTSPGGFRKRAREEVETGAGDVQK